jgi:cbb3-type cytochrome c oxidase subunit III
MGAKMNYVTRLGLALGLIALGGVRSAEAQGAAPSAAVIAKGDSIFHGPGMCYACHGSKAEGMVGPNLTDAEWIHGDGSVDMIVKTVTHGIPKEESKSGIVMPPKGGSSISDDDVKAVAAYVYSLSHKGK